MCAGASARAVNRRAILTILSTLAALGAALGVLTLSADPAFAKLAYPFDGQLAPVSGSFGNLQAGSVAVDDSNGDTYVADSGSGVVDVFETATGTELASLTGLETPAKSFGGGPVEVAANDGTGAVYVLDSTDNVVDVFESNGTYHCQITGAATPSASECNGVAGSKTPAEHFSGPGGIAVDQATGEVYVVDANDNAVDVFSLKGAYLRQISLGSIPGGFSASETRGIAVDDFDGDVYVSDSEPEVVYVFNATTGSYETTWSGSPETNPPGTPAGFFGFAKVSVAADNANGNVYVTESYPEGVTDVFEPSGGYVGQFSNTIPGVGTAVDQASGRIYVSRDPGGERNVVEIFGPAVNVPEVTTGSATTIRPTSATLNGTINPDGVEVTECHFDYVPRSQFEAGEFKAVTAAEEAPCEQTVGSGTGEVSVTAKVQGLHVGTTYDFRLQAGEEGTAFGSDERFSTLPPPAITGAAVSHLSAESADLEAQVDPGGLEIESCFFEYGTEAGVYAKQIACTPALLAQIGSGTTPVSIAQHIERLEPNITYHWRLVASNEAGTTAGVDHTFVYPETGGGLPDHRAYELVTPPQKNGALVGDVAFAVPPDVSEDGSRVMAVAVQCFGGALSCVPIRGFATVGVPYAFTRTAAGWATVPLAPPAGEFEEDTTLLYNADAGATWFSAPTPPHGEDDFYAREPDGSFVDIGPVSPPEAGRTSLETLQEVDRTGFDATADLSHVVFFSPKAFAHTGSSLVEYSHDGSAEPIPVGVSGPGAANDDLISECGIALAGPPNGLSADGRTVYFNTAGESSTCPSGTGVNAGRPVLNGELFARVEGGEAGAHTVAISEPRQLSPAEPDEQCSQSTGCLEDITEMGNWDAATFEGASSDGSKAFFTGAQRLTDEATQGSNNLYLYDFALPVGHRLTDVSAGDTSAGGPQVQGAVGYSSDGSHVYFVAQGVLSSAPSADAQGSGPHGEPVGSGAVAQPGADNLYVFDTATRRTSFIATLPSSDSPEWQHVGNPANVTPDGRFLVFTSAGALTADDTRTDGARQVFEYDAQTGRLVRVSIGEDGFDDDGNAGAGDATIVRGFNGSVRLGPARLDPTMSDDGAYVFFMSPLALTHGALDDVRIGTNEHGEAEYAENVYEYHEGNVYLISDGGDTNIAPAGSCEPSISAVCLLGSDASGANVFFTSADPLVPADTDPQQLNVYDARICEPQGGNPCIQPAPPVLPPCLGEACHGIPPATPPLLAPGSASFDGAGNLAPKPASAVTPRSSTRSQRLVAALRACGKERGRGARARCKKQARRRYGSSKAGKASRTGRAGKTSKTGGARKARKSGEGRRVGR